MTWFFNKKIILLIFLIFFNLFYLNSIILYILLLFFVGNLIINLIEHRNQLKIVKAEFQSGLIYSPISGRVINIIEDQTSTSVHLKSAWYQLSSICFPTRGEVETLEYSLKKSFNSQSLRILMNCAQSKIELCMSSAFYVKNDFLIREGDIGDAGAIFSYLPFNGSLEIRLPPGAKVSVRIGDNVLMGKTTLTSLE